MGSDSTQHAQDHFAQRYVNLADPRLGAKAIYATDDFFAPCERMLKADAAQFIADKFDQHGKWMDGWESRRKRVEGYDYCIVRLGRAAQVRGVNIDTRHFKGNHPPAASIDACYWTEGDPPVAAEAGAAAVEWVEILPAVGLQQDRAHLHAIEDAGTYTHLRLNIYPDGGIARFRVYGEPHCDWTQYGAHDVVDLVALDNGGRALACSNQAFGSSILNLTRPDRALNMGDGWETARRRVPGNEWAILALGQAGVVTSIELDTLHYKGNYPDRASVQGGYLRKGNDDSLVAQSMFWPELLPPQKLRADSLQRFEAELCELGALTHVRVNIIPDGGLGRVRLHGHIHR